MPGEVGAARGTAAACDRLDEPDGCKLVQNYVLVSDGGPDERASRRMAFEETRRDPCTWVWDSDCFAHAYHLIVKLSLIEFNVTMEKVTKEKYVSTLTKLLNVWREKAVILVKVATLFQILMTILLTRLFGPCCPNVLDFRASLG